jgi:tetratricopeptide (TPR) repeat protein/NAD-dependent dihydropyrimidine dehydrogenase PreA subunit
MSRARKPVNRARAAAAPEAPAARPSRYGKWRACALAGVYVLMGLHIAHWKMTGKTLAPLELNEVMHTLELGIITAGFLFMITACGATLFFGRFFCGWGCHILALQDLCSWILKKLRITPRPIRSRLLLVVPLAAMLYMFVWPQVTRVARGEPLPQLRLATDAHGWASFQTTNFWRNLPGPGVTLLTLGVCGFAIVYVLGSRSFCAYVCPYGAVFRGLDRLSPGRVVAAGDCANCAVCTSVCPSHVVVHEELQRFGTVVNAACVRDLECVSACPNGAVKYGLGRPPLLRGWRAWWPIRRQFDFTLAEEALIVVVLLATLLAFRGLYDLAPFLLTLALGAILGYAAVCFVRMAYRREVRIGRVWIKQDGRTTRAGTALLAAALAFVAFWAHSAFVRYHEYCGYRGARAIVAGGAGSDGAALDRALAQLETARRWGLITSPRLAGALGQLYTTRGRRSGESGAIIAALADLTRAAELQPDAASVRYNLAVLLAAVGREAEALAQYRQAAALDPNDADIQNNLGLLLAQRDRLGEAEPCFRRALELDSTHAHAHFNLGRLLMMTARRAEAATHLEAAARLDHQYAALASELSAP